MKKTFSIFSALLFLTISAGATVINVPGTQATIQSGINSAVNGDTVLVEPGTYFENINFWGKNIVLTSRYYLTLDPATINGTVINGSTPVDPDTASCVIIAHYEDSTTVLQGFTITGGTGTRWADEHSLPSRFREGGGVLIQYSKPIIQNNIIRNNQAINITGAVGAGGGGIRIGDSNPTVINNIIMQNQGRYGPGIVLNYSGGTFKNNIILLNTGGQNFGGGGAFWILSNSPVGPRVIENNTIINNTTTTGCGGVYCSGTIVTLRNNIIRGNVSVNAVQIDANGGIITATYNDIQGGYTGAGNINLDPLYADSNYTLASGSPCIDIGDSSTIYNDLPDPANPTLAKFPSRGGLRNDMGAYGGPLTKILTNLLIGIPPIGSELPVEFALYQNYPNPFNPNTKITFDLPLNDHITLKVYDAAGKEVSILVNEFRQSGRYVIDLNLTKFSSGIYFYRFISGNISITKKMILVK